MKKYNIIYADPPWKYNDKMVMTGIHGAIKGADSFYNTMGLKEIKDLPEIKLLQETVFFLYG